MIEYPPPYECLVWNYKHSDQNVTAKALDQVDYIFFSLAINWKNDIYKNYTKMAKQIITIFSYKMQYQKYQ